MRHSSFCSAIGQTFGVVKKRFLILKTMHCLAYSFAMQRKIVMCCFLSHNFIRVTQGYEDEYDVVEDEEEDRFDPHSVDVDESDDNTPATWRDGFASRMWIQYKRELMPRASLLQS